ITLSREQKRVFEERIREEHLENDLKVELLDYRDLDSLGISFDRIVSVGMAEHVGRDNYRTYMECIRQALKPGGLVLLHFISALKEHPGDAWMKKYIFPGGVVPSLREMMQIAGELNLYTLDVESLRRHYSRTLLCWYENFQKHRREVTEMFDERFARMWELYLCSCAATFMDGVIDLHQILWTNGINNDLPMTRWY
ncbi:MAG TPA: SAM-dependent methyltransferase, partial [Lachnospiraceae bacterium]|nr:SAM-dependent methyltransferase [Lachnospiraceae bacterium]